MKKYLSLMLMMMLMPLSLLAADELLMTLKTTATSCSILIGGYVEGYIDVDCGNGPEEKELHVAELDTETGGWSGSILNLTPADGVIKIYGEARNIQLLNLDGCYLTEADLSPLTNLAYLYMNHNEELEALDLSALTNLRYMEVTDCPMTKGPFVIGEKPNLWMMLISRTGNFADFDLGNYPMLKYLACWGNPDITRIDAEKCPDLLQLSCDGTNVDHLDVSKNPNLQILNISDTRIAEIDLSQNTQLREFYAQHESGTINTDIKLDEIDVTKNTNLIRLSVSGNRLKSIDVSQNPYLIFLNVSNNQLTNIDLSHNEYLSEVNLAKNYFGFSTLPLPSMYWQTYDYYQNDMKIGKTQAEGTVLDFSDMVLREGTNTTIALYQTDEINVNNIVELDESYYTFDATTGKVTLLKSTPDSVYLAFANDGFPALELNYMPLRTNKFIVKTQSEFGKPIEALSLVPTEDCPMVFAIGIAGASPMNPKQITVDYGADFQETIDVTSERPEVQNVIGHGHAGKPVRVYIDQDDAVTSFGLRGLALDSIDLTKARSLRWLTLKDTRLKAIDLGWNNMLERIEMTGNDLDSLYLAGANYAYSKTMLTEYYLSDNNLRFVELTDNNQGLRHVDLSHNKLTRLSFKDADWLQTLDLSDNQFTELDLNYCALMTKLNVANNALTSLVLAPEHSIQEMHLEGNAFTFASLPQGEGIATYIYAPQQTVTIARRGSGLDLSAHMVEGVTHYAWYNGEQQLQAGTDYTETNGRFVFASALEGQTITCQMTNDLFPGLTIPTTEFTIVAMPTHQLASFTTLASQTGVLTLRNYNANATLCIDWNGDGTNLVSYTVPTTDTYDFEVQTTAGANAKVYSYEEENGFYVFELKNMQLADVDMSGLTELTMLAIEYAGISDLKWPNSKNLMEVSLPGNKFSTLDLGEHTQRVVWLNLANNEFETFDASIYPNLGILTLWNNKLTSVNLDNASIQSLDLGRNQLEEVDLTKMPWLNSVALTENKLTHLDLSGQRALAGLFIDRNLFRFSTLPADKGYPKYTYANQADIEVEEQGGTVDLSGEAVVNDSLTTYRWFVGKPSIDEETGEFVGEELELDEYSVEGGITYFNLVYDGLVCVMTNPAFPYLNLYTTPVNVHNKYNAIDGVKAAQLGVEVDGRTIKAKADADVQIYDAQGRLLAQGNKAVSHTVAHAGVYLVVTSGQGAKVCVK